MKYTGCEIALTLVYFNDTVRSKIEMALMVKVFGLKSSNFFCEYYQ